MESYNQFAHFTDAELCKIRDVTSKFANKTQIAIARTVDGEPWFCEAIKNDAGVSLGDNAQAVFDIGSISKVFTSALLAKQVQLGRVSFDTDIAELLDLTLNNNVSISLKQLANHTSGLPRLPAGLFWEAMFRNKANPYANYDESRLKDYLQYKLKLRKPGKFEYSNLGAGMLGLGLSKLCCASYQDLLQQHVCDPFGLTQTTTLRGQAGNNLVQGLSTKGKPVPYWDLAALLGVGGIYSSVSDLAKFMLANFDAGNGFLQLQHQTTAQAGKELEVGLGWFMRQRPSTGETMLFHDGGTSGFTSIFIMNVKRRCGVVILSNVSSYHFFKARLLPEIAKMLYQNIP